MLIFLNFVISAWEAEMRISSADYDPRMFESVEIGVSMSVFTACLYCMSLLHA
jgi:hypothetical protein